MVPEGLPFQILHRNEGLPLEFADVVNRTYIGMIEGRGCLRFALETFQSVAILGQRLGQEFEGDQTV